MSEFAPPDPDAQATEPLVAACLEQAMRAVTDLVDLAPLLAALAGRISPTEAVGRLSLTGVPIDPGSPLAVWALGGRLDRRWRDRHPVCDASLIAQTADWEALVGPVGPGSALARFRTAITRLDGPERPDCGEGREPTLDGTVPGPEAPVRKLPPMADSTPTLRRVEIVSTTGDLAICIDRAGDRYTLPASESAGGLEVGRRLTVALTGGVLGDSPVISETDPAIVAAVLEGIVPELRDGTVRIMGVARSPGVRTKVAVAATAEGIDAVRACVGRSAGRVRSTADALGGERVDIVAWHHEPAAYAAAALAPAAVRSVRIDGDVATATVAAHQMAAAIGGGGLNSRLASELVGLHIVAEPEPAGA